MGQVCGTVTGRHSRKRAVAILLVFDLRLRISRQFVTAQRGPNADCDQSRQTTFSVRATGTGAPAQPTQVTSTSAREPEFVYRNADARSCHSAIG